MEISAITSHPVLFFFHLQLRLGRLGQCSICAHLPPGLHSHSPSSRGCRPIDEFGQNGSPSITAESADDTNCSSEAVHEHPRERSEEDELARMTAVADQGKRGCLHLRNASLAVIASRGHGESRRKQRRGPPKCLRYAGPRGTALPSLGSTGYNPIGPRTEPPECRLLPANRHGCFRLRRRWPNR
jgi:hypothetical protein